MSALVDPPAARSASAPATTPHARGRTLRERAAALPGWLVAIGGLAALVAASLLLRTQAITAKFWIDEGLSVGIAHHPFLDIPGVLRQDGSPPLYYLLLHVWMGITGGDGEARTHALSLLFAVLTIPAGWYLGRRLFGARSGWATAALCATCPFLTYYAQETRMYALVALLGLVGTGAFAAAYAQRDRRFLPVFAVAAALTVYTHNWGLFLTAGMGVAFLVLWRTAPAEERRPLFRDGLLGFGGVGLLYLPWVPTLLFQAAHTGAPWSERPVPNDVITSLYPLIGGVETALLVAFTGIGGLLTFRQRDALRPQARAALAIAVTAVAAVVLAWLASQASPAWASRYFAVFVGPLMLLVGAGIVRFGKLGLVALAVILFLWFDPRESQIRGKSDAYRVAKTLDMEGLLARDDLIVAIHPEQGPLLRYYLGPGYRWADALGPVPDNRVFDWRDALDRFKAAKPKRTFNSLATTVKPGQHLILLQPIIRTAKWGAPWTAMVRKRAPQWQRVADRDPRFARVGAVPQFQGRALPRGVRAVVYLRR